MDECKKLCSANCTTALPIKYVSTMKRLIPILTAFGFCFLNAAAQRPPAISSPDVNPDHSITFRYYSRTASRVILKGEFLKAPLAMSKDTSGVWSITVPPVKPDIYPYSFMVDTVELADPNNTLLFANVLKKLLTYCCGCHVRYN